MAFDYFNNNSALSNTGSFLTNAVNNMQGRYVPGKGWMSGEQIDALDTARAKKKTTVPTKTIVDDYERNSKPRRIREYLPTFKSKDPAIINKMYDSIADFEAEKFSSKSKTSSRMSKLLRDLSVVKAAAPTSGATGAGTGAVDATGATTGAGAGTAGDKTKNPQDKKKNSGTGSGTGKGKISAEYGTDLLTPDQVRDIQKASGELKVDGFVGPKTRAYAEKNGIPLTKDQFNAQPKVGEQVVTTNPQIPYTGQFSSMDNAAILYNLPSNVTEQGSKKQAVTPVEPGLASTQFNANDFKRFDDIRALQANQGMSELEATARYGQGMKSNASGLADAVTPNKAQAVVPAPVGVPVTNVVTPTNKVNPNTNDIARLNASIKAGMEAVDAQNYMKATTGK